MKTRILRFLLPAILVAAGSGSVFWTWVLAQHVEQLEADARQSATRIDRLDLLLDELSRAELSYVASGQIDNQTLTGSNKSLREIVSESSWLLGQSPAGASTAAGAIAEGIASLAEVEPRARENIAAGLDLMAADLLFTETTRTREALREQLRTLRKAESVAVAERRSNDLQQAWIVLGTVALLFAWALVRSPRRSGAAPAGEAAPDAEVSGHVSFSSLALTPRVVVDNALEAPLVPVSSVDLSEAAALCTAISRLQVETDLQDLLGRTAKVLDASGVAVWMTAGDQMFPVAWHGYDSRQLSQLGPISRSSMNALAAAWQSGSLQKVAGDRTSRSAIVAPLLGVERCIGVLAIETLPGRETDQTLQAVTAMVAAQLVTVLGAWPAGSEAAPADIIPFERASATN
jgi:hypothetical protein